MSSHRTEMFNFNRVWIISNICVCLCVLCHGLDVLCNDTLSLRMNILGLISLWSPVIALAKPPTLYQSHGWWMIDALGSSQGWEVMWYLPENSRCIQVAKTLHFVELLCSHTDSPFSHSIHHWHQVWRAKIQFFHALQLLSKLLWLFKFLLLYKTMKLLLPALLLSLCC